MHGFFSKPSMEVCRAADPVVIFVRLYGPLGLRWLVGGVMTPPYARGLSYTAKPCESEFPQACFHSFLL